jgi:hypothetical protein
MFISCQSHSTRSIEVTDAPEASETDTSNTDVNLSIDSLWEVLVFKDGGCLTGGQYVKDGHFGSKGCVMSEFRGRGKKWEEFFSLSKDTLTTFLITKLSDTTTTKIHTCPCMPAKNGEVAVYALQRIYKKNWYDLEGFTQYSKREGSGCIDNEQAWLWKILMNQESITALSKQWNNQL